ncbi:hypothetical protein Mth01_38040 [Sphaerimonospora thailandensis]|uniref:Uncharacterized protein n=1 Tax=Sphaerimonospora thailandensis TaxID=795644 RepID=A0A8J3W195_9ACTN|nr:hypothetical protein [Sphaerimonospora thailandensis]GIH71551.1 hypothetical protein Mth01_38040 [Sphaerimonospora thailandensis]
MPRRPTDHRGRELTDQGELDEAFALVAGRFERREVRLRTRRCLEGLLSGLERKNGWTLAESS